MKQLTKTKNVRILHNRFFTTVQIGPVSHNESDNQQRNNNLPRQTQNLEEEMPNNLAITPRTGKVTELI